ncbi:hypothetical protein [Clostridium omnivorum]|uniref:Uncharacterized protein n=1 Tax=Clostridium omnivorum TaxID=1604902 RepID=A0ABQ5N4D9_9CLOT|nr:hypothetical protein [Clostridium sp. E14]GLC29994.1 hypothetical protein bsdE14_14040 [Clostridium sp. E14]
MNEYKDIINDDEELFNRYEIIKIDDNLYLVPDAYTNTSDVEEFDEFDLIFIDVGKLTVNEGDTVSIMWWCELERFKHIVRLDNVDNDTFGYITLVDNLSDDGRYNLTCTIAALYKDIKMLVLSIIFNMMIVIC